MKHLSLAAIFVSQLILVACSSAPKEKQETTKVEGATQAVSSSLVKSLSDERRVLSDSEFNIIFPSSENSLGKRISAIAIESKVQASSTTGRRQIKAGRLEPEEYWALVSKLRGLDETQFKGSAAGGCQEPFSFRFRLADTWHHYVGCRGSGENASIISKTARDIEFLLIRGNAGH